MASILRVNTITDASSNNSIATSFVAGGSTKAWTHLNGTGTIAIQDSFNTSSATDRNTGSLGLFSLDAPGSTTPLIERSNVGVVNYKTGRITLNPINIVSGKTKDAQQIMEISVVPHSNDVIGLQDLYLQLDTSNVEMVVDEIASGADPSGSTYTVTSSYTERKIVR